jgi:hypothetical protein
MMKVNMFEGDEGYITYFSTDSAQDSSDFYDTIHSWRSYYLRVVKGQGSPTAATAHAQLLNSTDPGLRGAHVRNPSSDNAFLSKSFKPELDLDFGSFEVREESRKKDNRNSNLPLASNIIVPLNSHGIPSAAEHSAALHARQNNIRQGIGASAPPPVSYNTGSKARPRTNTNTSGTARSHARPPTANEAPKRTPSVRATPTYTPALHHELNSGKGFVPPVNADGPLIQYATTPESYSHSRGASLNGPATTGGGYYAALERNPSVAHSQRASRDYNGGRAPSGSISSANGRGLVGDLVGDNGFTGGGLLGGLK